MSSYRAQPIDESSRVPAQSQIAVTLLLPADDSPAFFSKEVREWQERFLTGSQTYTLEPVPSSYGPSGLTQPPETVQIPYNRVFVRTIFRETASGATKDYYFDLDNDQKWTLMQLYDTVRTLYRNNPPKVMNSASPTEWDDKHSAVYIRAFQRGVERFSEGLSRIALIPKVMSAADLITAVGQPSTLRDPAFNFHEILPADLSDGQTIATTGVNTFFPAFAATPDQIAIDNFVESRLTQGLDQWFEDDGTVCGSVDLGQGGVE